MTNCWNLEEIHRTNKLSPRKELHRTIKTQTKLVWVEVSDIYITIISEIYLGGLKNVKNSPSFQSLYRLPIDKLDQNQLYNFKIDALGKVYAKWDDNWTVLRGWNSQFTVIQFWTDNLDKTKDCPVAQIQAQKSSINVEKLIQPLFWS